MKATALYSFANAFSSDCTRMQSCSSHAMVEYFACACLAAACAFILVLTSVSLLGAIISVIICAVIIITDDNRICTKKVLLS